MQWGAAQEDSKAETSVVKLYRRNTLHRISLVKKPKLQIKKQEPPPL